MKRLLMILVCATLCLTMGGIADANLVVNGTFETISYTPEGVPIIAPSWNGWTQTLSTDSSNYGFWDVKGYGGPTNFGVFFAGAGQVDDAIGQVIPTDPGSWYTFKFCLARLSTSTIYPDNLSDFHAYWNGASVLDIVSNATSTWTYFTYAVQATGSATSIGFSGSARNSGAGYEFTDIQVFPGVPVPLPGTVVLLSSGLLSLLGWRRLRMR